MSLISVWRRTIERADKNKNKKHLFNVLGELKSSEEIQVRIWGGTSLEEWAQVWGLLSQGVICWFWRWRLRDFKGWGSVNHEESRRLCPRSEGMSNDRGPCRHYSSGLQPPKALTRQYQGFAKMGSDRNFQAWLVGL